MEYFDFRGYINGKRVADEMDNTLQEEFEKLPQYEKLVDALDKSDWEKE
ncbi:hypothetical protein V7128_05820 [Neobacillus vireti]